MTQFCRIEIAAELSGLPTRRIRSYVRLGFVQPARIDGRTPWFGDDELTRLRRIRRLTDDLGLNLAGVEVALRLLDQIAELRAQLERSRP